MWFTHNGDNSDATSGPDGASLEFREKGAFVFVGDGADNVDEAGDAAEAVLFGHFGPNNVERDRLVGIVGFDELCGDSRGNPEEGLGLGWT